MHIVHLVPEINKGGVENIVCTLNKSIVESGFKSTVISSGGVLVDKVVEDGGIHYNINLKSKNILSFMPRKHALYKILKKIKPNVIHIHSRVPAWMIYYANKSLKIPIIASIHGFNHISYYSRIMTRFDCTVCVSKAVKKYIVNAYNLDKNKVQVIHCGVDENKFSESNVNKDDMEKLIQRFNLKNKYIISTIGRFSRLKNFETFIKAIEINCKKNPDVIGLIIGYIPKKDKYYKKIKKLIIHKNLSNKIYIITSNYDICSIYKLSNIVVSCSKKPESFGLTLVESLFLNTPIIASNHGGPLEIINEGINGLLYSSENENELSKKIDIIRNSIYSNLDISAKENFSSKKMCQEYLTKYLNLID